MQKESPPKWLLLCSLQDFQPRICRAGSELSGRFGVCALTQWGSRAGDTSGGDTITQGLPLVTPIP